RPLPSVLVVSWIKTRTILLVVPRLTLSFIYSSSTLLLVLPPLTNICAICAICVICISANNPSCHARAPEAARREAALPERLAHPRGRVVRQNGIARAIQVDMVRVVVGILLLLPQHADTAIGGDIYQAIAEGVPGGAQADVQGVADGLKAARVARAGAGQ